MATPKFKMLSQALGAPEEGVTYPLGLSPEEQPGLFEDASAAALSRENALPREGYVPTGVGPAVEPSLDSTMAPMPAGLRSRKPVEFTPDTTKLQGKLAGFLSGDRSLESPIPTASASIRSDAPVASTSTLPSTGPQTPAGKPDSMGTPGLPAPSSEGAGGDALSRLGLGQALVRALEGSGSVIAGRDLRSGAAETLGERMKQIEALRAKREERALELGREDEQSAALVSQYKSLAAQGLVPELPALDRLPLKQAAGLIKTYGSLPGLVQRTEKTKAEIPLVQERVQEVKAKTDLTREKIPEVSLEGKSKRALRQAQIDKLRRQTAGNVVSLTRSAKAVEDAGKAGVPSKDAIKYIRDDIKTAEKAITPTLENLKNIERASPGFAFGKTPKDIETLEFVAAEKLPRFADNARDLRSAVEALIIDIRHGSFGASLTATEKQSFEAMLQTGLSGTVGQLARAINDVRRKAAATAQTHFNTSQTFYPTETAQVLSSSAVFGPATKPGGVYADVWTLPTAPAAPTAAAPSAVAAPVVERVIMIDKEGKRQAVRADQVERAKAEKGWRLP